VTPADSNGRRFGDLSGALFWDLFPTELASPFRDSFILTVNGSALRSPGRGNGTLYGDVYQTIRTGSGWRVVRHVTPTGAEAYRPEEGGVSRDHEYTFAFVSELEGGTNGSLSSEGESDYLGDPSGKFEPTGIGSLATEPYANGRYISPGGQHVIFSTGHSSLESSWCYGKAKCSVRKLEPEAPPKGTGAVYDRSADGPTHVVSLLPGNQTPAAGENATYQGVSADGSTVAFKIKGILYVRIDNTTTEEVIGGDPTYGGLSENGGFLFYESGGDIHRFNTVSDAGEQVNASGDAQMVNASTDGSHVYFISPSQLDGVKGTLGEPNMYVWSGDSPEYIATVDPADTTGPPALTSWTSLAVASQSNANAGPGVDSSRTTPDGEVVVFESKAQLTSYDNAGHTEIYRYDDEEKNLKCVSCNPSGLSAVTDSRLENVNILRPTTIISNVSVDGNRVYFETSESLVPEDVDDINDIYEWQELAGEGSAVNLISSGHSVDYPQLDFLAPPRPNLLLGVTPDGSDVFFVTQDVFTLGAGVGGVPAIYDARVGGGFPEPPPPPAPCLEEGCRLPATPQPPLGRAASAELQGSGNVVTAKKKKHRRRRCGRRGVKHRHCVRKRGRQATASARKESAERAATTTASTATAAALFSRAEPSAPSTRDAISSLSSGEPGAYGIESASAEVSTTSAAAHPDFTTHFELTPLEGEGSRRAEDIVVDLPPGLYGNPNLIPRCSTGDFLGGDCPTDSQVGLSRIELFNSCEVAACTVPLFNLAPVHPEKEIARFGFAAPGFPVFIDVSVRTASDYGVTAAARSAPGQVPLLANETVIWGNPADESHDELRITLNEGLTCEIPHCEPGGKRSTESLGPVAFMTNPSACQQNEVGFSVTSYQLPGQVFSRSAPLEPGPIDQCQGLPFAPSLEARPTTDVAGAPTGLKTKLTLPQSTDPAVPSTATMREARVTLPEGMTINPGAADGLDACSDEQVHFHEELDAQCPDASKLGTVEIKSPPLPRPIEGALYQRSPQGKGNLFGLWLVSDDLGLHIKIPGKVVPDPATGRLTAVFSDLPQVPVEEIDLDVWGGARAPLKNPDTCGTYETTSALSPHSEDPAATPSDSFLIDRGPNGGSCPSTASGEPNDPEFEAGTQTPVAAAFSPFVMKLHREDGSQQFGSLKLTLPPGLTGKLAGLSECSDASLAAAAAKSGAAEKANPSCPAQSHLGSVWAAAGAGPAPYWAKGNAYLAAPYKGAPLSVAIITPAVAGPFDLGTVLVRSALRLEPGSARITVISDPIPQILEGVPLNLRTVAVQIDRERFTLNGTSCDPLAFEGSLLSTLGNAAALKERFQLAECSRLKFKPKLSLALRGPTERAGFPALRAGYRARPGDADLKRLKLRFPRSEFIEQGHFRTICTRVQWAAGQGGGKACPKGSIYGHIRATTPLLDKPLAGPVYLRSSFHNLPDVVFALRGKVDAEVAVRIDSVKGGLQATIEEAPDVPISRAILTMRGGQKGLFVNSRDICAHLYRAKVGLEAHNGRTASARPALANSACGKEPRRHKHQPHRSR